MEYFEKYMARIQVEGDGPELLADLYQEAARSLQEDPPERALTLTGQMVSALLSVAKHQEPPERQFVDAVNGMTSLMVDYLTKMGWKTRAYKTSEGWKYESMPM